MFKLAFCYVFESDQLDRRLAEIKAAGYQGVEFWQRLIEELGIEPINQACRAQGVEVAQLCPYFNWVDGPEAIAATRELVKTYVAHARLTGCRHIRAFTGKPWGGPTVGPDQASPEQWRAAIDGLREACDWAAPYDLRIVLECHAGSLMEDTPSTLRLLEGVDRDNLRLNLQLPLGNGREDVDETISALGAYCVHMHIHNYTALPDGKMTDLETGCLDYHSVLGRLIEMGFDGWVSVEHAGSYPGQTAEEAMRKQGAYLVRLRRELYAS
jgi:sugar phosphate isomerase/epimerase